MRCLLHPSYFPNIAAMALLAQQECEWEIMDYFQKQTYRNRTYICTDQGKQMLSIPILHVGGKQGKQYYRDVRTDNKYPWQRQHWRSLQTAYRSSPFFEYYEDDLAPLFLEYPVYLLDHNFRCLEVITSLLNLNLPDKKTEQYHPSPKGVRDMRFLVNAKKAVSFDPLPYTQVFTERHGFIPNPSILDLLFNEGPNALNYLQETTLDSLYA
ncbi:WbqC family protein [Muriicola sp. E247]|uniref:WbqC family protein n=1 Tax=Muriicola sp. E247 TaxID=3242730 RepID=UPI003525768F